MHTITSPQPPNRAETRSISIAAHRDAVFAFVADPRNLPRWAPRFAQEVRPDGELWQIRSGDTEFPVAIVADAARGTFDLLRPPALTSGAFARVIHNGEAAAEFVFTLQFGPEFGPEAIAAQMAVVDDELRAVRDLVEAAGAA